MSDPTMRPETLSEHIARDMREGRFPEQSEPQMVPALPSDYTAKVAWHLQGLLRLDSYEADAMAKLLVAQERALQMAKEVR